MSIFTFFENRLNPYPKINLPIPKNQGLFAGSLPDKGGGMLQEAVLDSGYSDFID